MNEVPTGNVEKNCEFPESCAGVLWLWKPKPRSVAPAVNGPLALTHWIANPSALPWCVTSAFHPGGDTIFVGLAAMKSEPGTQEYHNVPMLVVPVSCRTML